VSVPEADMTTATDVMGRVCFVFESKLQLSVDSVDTDLFAEGLLDSVAFVELLLHLESEFGVKVALQELEIDTFRTIGNIASFIESRRGEADHR
jgi:methoxymalonate biosynthesis acyl carrier protein